MPPFGGCIAALPTPFLGAALDLRRFAEHVERLVADGVDALAVGGATGEMPTLAPAEFDLLIRACNEACDLRVPILAHVVSSGTEKAVILSAAARRAGADGLLLACPSYNRPTQEGLYRHAETVSGSVPLPLLLHDDPDRTRVALAPETIGRLARLADVVGLVDGTGDPARADLVRELSDGRWAALSGVDGDAAAFALAGGEGGLSDLANLAPRACALLHAACRRGEWAAARRLQARLRPLAEALALDPSPATVKRGLSLLRPGFGAQVRLPLVEAAAAASDALAAALAGFADARFEGDGEDGAVAQAA